MKSFKKGDKIQPLPKRHSSNDYMYKASKANGGGIKEMKVVRLHPGQEFDVECKVTKGRSIRKWYDQTVKEGSIIYVSSNSVELMENNLYAIF